LLVSFISDVTSQGTGVDVRPEQDTCSGATGPRPITNQRSPGTTLSATIDDVNGGFCGVEIDTPGIWWWVNGTGSVIRASSCDSGTQIKVKVSVFTGSCDALRCVAGGSRPDFECEIVEKGESEEWGSISTAIDFPTYKGQHYYILVQQMSLGDVGSVWMKFRHPNLPQNDACINAVGPVPRDRTWIAATTEDAALSEVPEGVCKALDYYPGVWYQIIGTGNPISVMACGETNIDGFYFSVYNGGFCDDKSCVEGDYETQILDEERCTFTSAFLKRPMTRYTFPTRDRDRYFIYVHFAFTGVDKPTAPFRFFVDDGESGNAGSSGTGQISFEDPQDGGNNGNGNDNGNGNGNDGSNNGNNGDGNGGNSGASSRSLQAAGAALFFLLSSFLLL
jgi:hypothetical protein